MSVSGETLLVLWTTADKFYVTSEDFPAGILIIDRVTGQTKSELYRHQIPSNVTRKAISGIIGVINLVSGPHLVVALSKKKIGCLTSDNHVIWVLDGVQIIPFTRSEAHIRLEQKETALEQRKMVEDIFSTPYFYFSYSLDITNCQQKADVLVENNDANFAVLHTASPCFTWNYFMLKTGGFVQNPDFHPWCIALIHGAVFIQQCSLNGKLLRWSLISRRSSKRAGTRFFRRGCDFQGNVANYVETEQIIEHHESLTSFVQIRGSMPFFWKQSPTLAYLPKPEIYTHVDHNEPFQVHLEKLVHNYGTQVLVNLINHNKHEGVLQAKFQELHKTCQLKQYVEYKAFDFHANPGNKLGRLIDELKPRIEEQACFFKTRGVVSKLQTGAIRTNCMDSLDRTNVVQSLIALENLKQVLKKLAIPHVNLGDSDFYKVYQNVWANHANIIALQYASSEALKTDITRCGKRTLTGMLRDAKTAIVRYINNNFNDGRRMDAIDLVLGHYTVDVYWTVDTERGKRKNLLYFLPLGLLVTSSMLLLTSLLFSESQEEFVLLLICFLSLVFLLMMLILRHSKLYVDLPKYCPYELIETLKI